MRFLILSDIHSNRQALDAVAADAAGHYDQILCLGDVVGYGADPNAVTEWVRAHVPVTVRGNHDRAATGDQCILNFSDDAATAAMWTGAQLSAEHLQFLAGLPQGPLPVEDFSLVHGSPRDEDDYIVDRADAIIASSYLPTNICFFGHTHVQGGCSIRRGRFRPLDPEAVLQLEPDTAYLINPGSVGQPRDDDPRAAYLLYDSSKKVVTFRRVAYDVAEAQRVISAAKLPPFLAARLAIGR